MHGKKSSKKSVIITIILAGLMIASYSPGVSAASIDNGDGFWTDTFQSAGSVTLSHCEIKEEAIVLVNETSNQTYDFTSSGNKAYSYKTLMFIPFFSALFYLLNKNLDIHHVGACRSGLKYII